MSARSLVSSGDAIRLSAAKDVRDLLRVVDHLHRGVQARDHAGLPLRRRERDLSS